MRQKRLIRVLEQVAPGTELREAVDRILQVGSGALIVIGDYDELTPIVSGGFQIDCDFTAPRLFELAKMDGAVILSGDLKEIHMSNVHLVPDPSVPAYEAGMRHRTAERVAKQTSAFVLAISEEMNTVSIYYGEEHFTLENIPLVLAKADQGLQTLSRYRVRLDREFARLNTLEFDDLVTLKDVIRVVQRTEMVMRMADEVRFQVSELGKDGRLVSLQLNELIARVPKLRKMLMKDYCQPGAGVDVEAMIEQLEELSSDELMDNTMVLRSLGYRGSAELLNKMVRPCGYRVLSMIPRLPGNVIQNLVERFDNLRNLMRASPALLEEVDGVGDRRALMIKEGLDRISESIIPESYS